MTQSAFQEREDGLQWGHASSSVERRLSWQRASSSGGRFNGATLLQAWRGHDNSQRIDYPASASMGPRFFKRGENIRASKKPASGRSFNGATLLQAWRVYANGVEDAYCDELQWGHASSSVESSASAPTQQPTESASMGPRFFKRGETSPAKTRPSLTSSFNGATLLQAWRGATNIKATTQPASFNGATLLQAWRGHAGRNQDAARPASMGPRFFKRGELPTLVTGCPPHWLQWGHASSSVERLTSAKHGMLSTSLQWGHASSSVERWRWPRSIVICRARFNGATLLQAWRVPRFAARGWPGRWLQWGHASSSVESAVRPYFYVGRPESFNGATLLQAWRDDGLLDVISSRHQLQWGHASSSVERPPRHCASRELGELQWGHASSSVERSHQPGHCC